MKRGLLILLLASGGAGAQETSSAPAMTIFAAPFTATQPLSLVLRQSIGCDPGAEPGARPDPSGALTFAAHPLQQLSPDDAAFENLAPLLSLRFGGSPLRLLAFGSPLSSWWRLQLRIKDAEPGWYLAGC